jgi:hypothetical protein
VLLARVTLAFALPALSPTFTFVITLAAGLISVLPITSATPDFAIKFHCKRLPTLSHWPLPSDCALFTSPLGYSVSEEFFWFVTVFFMFVIEVALEV